MTPLRAGAVVLASWTLVACRGARPPAEDAATEPAASASAEPSDGSSPPPRVGMVWVRPGALVAGTPPDVLPRVADQEMPGEQVILRGFYIDVYPYPNEEGAIPVTNVTRDEAARLCATRDARLCSELEWERACKGPSNRVYEYGDSYRPERCGTGVAPALRPAGIRIGCQTEFGVRDLHGGALEWTASPWGRDTAGNLATLRGGNGTEGALAARCANAVSRAPGKPSPTVGFRCCAGPKNGAEVTLAVRRGPKLDATSDVDRGLATELIALLGQADRGEIREPERFVTDRAWIWRPTGNEELSVLGGCSGFGRQPSCGVLIARKTLVRPMLLAWASSAYYAPTLQADAEPRSLWLFGGDQQGTYRRLISYVWGKVVVGSKERRVPRPKKKPR